MIDAQRRLRQILTSSGTLTKYILIISASLTFSIVATTALLSYFYEKSTVQQIQSAMESDLSQSTYTSDLMSTLAKNMAYQIYLDPQFAPLLGFARWMIFNAINY
ncbi:hypothetical protein AB4Z17_27795 [Paenibacillus sp. TAF43_2]|uniref:hypothetical protein n=1 Tax=Paenibacillus sp. TAF43_2 TaxID=3233069 RepID=UPI003F962A37